MKDVKNKQLRNKLNKLRIKDIVLNFSEGSCGVWSEDELTDVILNYGNPFIYVYKFNDMSIDSWVEEIKNIFDEALKNYENAMEYKKNWDGHIKIGNLNLKESNDEKLTDYFSNKVFEKTIKDGLRIYKDVPMELEKVEYDEKTKTLSISASFYYKAYGKSYSYDKEYIGKRIPYGEGDFKFNNDLNEDDVSMLVFLIQKDGTHYPTSYFHYVVTSKVQPMDFVDTIVLNYRKNFD